MTAMKPQETDHPTIPLKLGNVDVQVHPVDPLDFQRNVILKYVSHRVWYTHDRALVAVGQTANRPQSGHNITDGFDRTDSQSARALCIKKTATHTTRRSEASGEAAEPR